ncbi:aromatic acid exporter family protein [Paenibacillus shenyangensis]|uniref:aromatic acid exporter family protein n=1 Tax=Paenibacillus sp. A9 TaxID=1284352 RepID=UPI00037F0EF6|nr:aromatic acid exporter family protein [Paenibacillus sp. A9]
MGFRVIKTAIAALLAVVAASTLGISSAMSAALLAILGVDVTRKRSLQTISARFFASLIGMVCAFVLFSIFGFQHWVFALYILLAFPIITRAGFSGGIVTSSVIVVHIYNGGLLTAHAMLVEVELLLIGLGSAAIVNLVYMPNPYKRLNAIRREVNELLSQMFEQIARTLHEPAYVWDGEEVIQATAKVEQGHTAAKRELENQMLHPDESWIVYFYMRKQHLDSIQNMMQLVAQVYSKMPQGDQAAQIFEQLAQDVKTPYYTGKTEKLLLQFEEDFSKTRLPVTREEFEVYSAILQLCRELEQYLKISKRDKARNPLLTQDNKVK